MPEPACPAVIASSLTDAAAFISPRGGDWCRLLVHRDRPVDIAGTYAPSVTVTQAAMDENPSAAHELVQTLAQDNPDIEVHLPTPPRTFPTQEEIDQVRAELEQDTDDVLAARRRRRAADRVLIFAPTHARARAAAAELGLDRYEWEFLATARGIYGRTCVRVHITPDAYRHEHQFEILASLLIVARGGHLELLASPRFRLSSRGGVPMIDLPDEWGVDYVADDDASPEDAPLADWQLELVDPARWARQSTMRSPAVPPVGSFGLSRIGGLVGALVTAGQAVLWDGSRYTHAFVVVDGGWVVQAMPGGAELASLGDYLGRDDVVFCDDPVDVAVTNFACSPHASLAAVDRYEGNLREAIAAHARGLVGTPYSFADYLALAAVRLGLPSRALRRYVAGSGRMICSQLVDETYRRAGIHLFDDGRPSHDVTPGDLDAWRVTQLELRAGR